MVSKQYKEISLCMLDLEEQIYDALINKDGDCYNDVLAKSISKKINNSNIKLKVDEYFEPGMTENLELFAKKGKILDVIKRYDTELLYSSSNHKCSKFYIHTYYPKSCMLFTIKYNR